MFWTTIAMALVAALVTLVAVVVTRRPFDVRDLGSVSDRWIAEHHVDSSP
jgi:hypothetical protein